MKIKQYSFYKNIKNETIYNVVDIVTNVTNAQDGDQMVLYKATDSNQLYVREIEEFKTKFVEHEV